MSKSIITSKRYGMRGRNSYGVRIGRNFKAVREAKGLTPQEAAKGMGYPVSAIYVDLEGCEAPTLEILTTACDFYGCTPNDVLMLEVDNEYATCPRCQRDYSKGEDRIERAYIAEDGYCQICRSELSRKFASGQHNRICAHCPKPSDSQAD